MASLQKLQDMQEIETTVTGGTQTAAQAVTNNLKNPRGVAIPPTYIVAEVLSVAGGGAGVLYAVVSKIVRAATPFATFTASLYLNAAAAGDAKVKVRYTSVYVHTIQGNDNP